jgi:hypothetical protein
MNKDRLLVHEHPLRSLQLRQRNRISIKHRKEYQTLQGYWKPFFTTATKTIVSHVAYCPFPWEQKTVKREDGDSLLSNVEAKHERGITSGPSVCLKFKRRAISFRFNLRRKK